ncbi:MAG TPA: peptidoglycan DD-metalloendopeptidase family protein [Solirubrobacteraceae bacterium]|nr:peptidoglycan DD-metalloendopeptidase family protein [Solirubrobacteraceae bacterium]
MPPRGAVTLATAVAAAAAGPAAAQQQALSVPAVVESIACVSGCSSAGAAAVGSVVRIRGRSMARVRHAVFVGGRGPADDVAVAVLRAQRRSVDVVVPEGARSGRVRLRNADGVAASPGTTTVAIARGAPPPVPGGADRDTTDAIDARVDRSTVFFAGEQDATLRYVVTADAPVEVAVELVRRGGGRVARWTPGPVAPGAEQRVDWDGTVDGAAAPPGRYEFRVAPVAAVAAQAAERPEVVDSFRFLDHKFPVRGRHDFGGPAAVFGTAREGHSHQGQDVFAACGTPMVAARGGRVVFRASHARAGHYVVVRGEGNGVDYVYMHLAAPAVVTRGEPVRTGQPIGAVGDTGNARGCHLHFELWSPPGWFEGGAPFDPLPSLRAWDAVS